MAKVTTVLLQGVSYRWDGQDILVDDGVGIPWPLGGHALEQVELFDGEGESVAAFTIDFEGQRWFLSGPGAPGDIILLDEMGVSLAVYPPGMEEGMPLPSNVLILPESAESMATDELVVLDLDDILYESEQLEPILVATSADTAHLDGELIDDVINWLAVYSHHD
ncbi:hypothetical protein [Oceanisphaera arctica]|uniref:Uncharacterized protein n=1 Tax=Oceanisphaera arctica TaxID=641510 RepID=A0A2P5TLK6_9GAMM|nr:hypothetical protein [Oceanisphaera arctica]PPL16216.1 hypothetical protein UN63_09720 [Oceanisphaera arctica]GHA11515.1 hypothetical protein GCM10007082_10690 [Oceanisphaera arctica]